MKQNQNKGITLVSLVITIILLLILAGISIATLTGSGLFEKAKLAEQESKNTQELEDSTLKDYENTILNYSNRNSNNPKGIMTAFVNQTYSTTSNPEPIKFNQVFSSIGDTFELSNNQIIIKKDIKYVKVSAQIMCTNGFQQTEVPNIVLKKNNNSILQSLTRFTGTSAETINISNALIEVTKNDIIQVVFTANSTNRGISGNTTLQSYITIEEI